MSCARSRARRQGSAAMPLPSRGGARRDSGRSMISTHDRDVSESAARRLIMRAFARAVVRALLAWRRRALVCRSLDVGSSRPSRAVVRRPRHVKYSRVTSPRRPEAFRLSSASGAGSKPYGSESRAWALQPRGHRRNRASAARSDVGGRSPSHEYVPLSAVDDAAVTGACARSLVASADRAGTVSRRTPPDRHLKRSRHDLGPHVRPQERSAVLWRRGRAFGTMRAASTRRERESALRRWRPRRRASRAARRTESAQVADTRTSELELELHLAAPSSRTCARTRLARCRPSRPDLPEVHVDAGAERCTFRSRQSAIACPRLPRSDRAT